MVLLEDTHTYTTQRQHTHTHTHPHTHTHIEACAHAHQSVSHQNTVITFSEKYSTNIDRQTGGGGDAKCITVLIYFGSDLSYPALGYCQGAKSCFALIGIHTKRQCTNR